MTIKTATVGADIEVPVYDAAGKKTKATFVLPGSIFDVPLNIPLIHQVVEAQRAAARQGTHATKTRGMVSGGGKKPWRQKGTGRARQGSIRAPQWKGGGVVHGPQPRDYSQRTPKKMIAGALRSALSDRARNQAIFVFSALVEGERPSTKAAIATLSKVTDAKKVLVVIDRDEAGAELAAKSYTNIPGAHVIWADQINAYDVVDSDRIVATEAALTQYISRVQASSRKTVEVSDAPESKVKATEEKKADKTEESYEADHAAKLAKTAEAEAKKAAGKAKKSAKADKEDAK